MRKIARSVSQWVARKDFVVLAAGLIVVAGVWFFIVLAGEVTEGDTGTFDGKILRSLREPHDLADPIGPDWLESAVRDVTALGSVTVLCLMTGIISGFLAIRRQFHALGLLLSAIIGGTLLNTGLKALFHRARPELVPHLMEVTSASFPSGHSMLAAVCYLTLAALLTRLVEGRKLKLYILAVAFFLAFIVGMSRVYLGVHYPTDVLAGWMLGLVWALVCWLVAQYLQQRGAVEPEK